MSRTLTLVFAFVAGAASANLYWAQPLVEQMSRSLAMPPWAAGLLITVTLLGFGLAVILVVPLGDVIDPRRPILIAMATSCVALALAAAAPNWQVLMLALTAIGATTVAVPLILPLSSHLAAPSTRGKVVGTVVSGLLLGILLSRVVSGAVAAAFGWRMIYLCAAILAACLTLVLWIMIPRIPSTRSVPYGKLLFSILSTVRGNRPVAATLVIAFSLFVCFGLVWTGTTFLLSAPPYSYSVAGIGFVGAAGLAGAVMAQGAGRLHDRGLSTAMTGLAIATAFASFLILGLGSCSIAALLIGLLVFDAAFQTALVLNQTRLFSGYPQARGRLNTALVTTNSLGGALGAGLAGVLWHGWGWPGVIGAGLLASALAGGVWAVSRRHLSSTAATGH
jgi:predicted MFS family arabinose efflux permease